MNKTSRIFSLFSSGFTTDNYYKSMNQALKNLNNEYTMLHYPYYHNDTDSFLDAQKNLTDYCISRINTIKGKNVLEIGCGNGVHTIYLKEKYSPAYITGIDLNQANIRIAREETKRQNINNIEFQIDDAQKLSTIESSSLDCIINIESAFHYPDKASFLKEIYRILKPGGTFLIADILTSPYKSTSFRKFWKKKMHYHHWSKQTYESELQKASLQINSLSDITERVIRGFENYRYWLRSMEKGSFLKNQILKLFYSINVELNMYLLRSRRQYCVISGQKPF